MTQVSQPRAVELAKRLKAAGAQMYGAFWCSHCFDQKQDFGRDAMADFPYVECYPDGFRKVCSRSFSPTALNHGGISLSRVLPRRLPHGAQQFLKP